jgi:predicted enzyme related to lactoylglutathione lyase
MPNPFVWFDLRAARRDDAARFYADLLNWDVGDDGALAGPDGPWGAIGEEPDGGGYWLPYIQVDDVDEAARQALGLGGTLVQQKTAGPAGFFVVVEDPAGARIALWQP